MIFLWSAILPVILFSSSVAGCNKQTFQNTLIKFSIDEVGDFSNHQYVDGCITPLIVSPKVTIIECYNQSLPSLKEGAVANMLELTSLVFTENSIGRIKRAAFTNLPKLEQLILSNNKIKSIDVGVFSVLPSVSRLLLDRNQLTFLGEGIFSNMPNLRHLSLNNNQLDSIEYEWFNEDSSLTLIRLSHNMIRRVPKDAFKRVKNLEILDLRHNKILTVHETAFQGSTSLYNLDLSNNRIFQLTGKVFAPLHNIDTLYLHGNNLTYIHTKVLEDISPTLREISIYSNPWQCACYNNILQWVRRDPNLKIDNSINCRIALNPVCVTPTANPKQCLEDVDEELDSTFYETFIYSNKTCGLNLSYR